MAEDDLRRPRVDGPPEHVLALSASARARAHGADPRQRLRALLLEGDGRNHTGMHHTQPVFGQIEGERRVLEQRPIHRTQCMREPAMHAAHRRLRGRLAVHPRLPRRAPVEQLLLVISPHHDRPGAPHDIEHAERVGTSRHQVTHEHEAIAGRKGHALEQLLELDPASMHIADDDRPHRFRAHKKRGVRPIRKGSR